MKSYYHVLGVAGFLLWAWGVVSAVLHLSGVWYFYFVVGGVFFLAWVNLLLKNESLFEKDWNYILKRYFIYLVFAILIEIVGRFVLGLWYYPSFSWVEDIFLDYPFAFFLIYESFKIFRKWFSPLLAVILTTFSNAFAHEIPNTFTHKWIYKIPYVRLEILGVNVVVIFGWIILVAVPLVTERILGAKESV